MKISNTIRKYYRRVVAVPAMSALVVLPAAAQEAGGGGVDISAAENTLGQIPGAVATIGGLLLAAVATISLWKYLKAGAAS